MFGYTSPTHLMHVVLCGGGGSKDRR